MVKRLLFDRVDAPGNEFSVGVGVENATSILPDIADAKFPIRNQAMVTAQKAGNLIVFHSLIEHPFFQHSFSPLFRLNGITFIPYTF